MGNKEFAIEVHEMIHEDPSMCCSIPRNVRLVRVLVSFFVLHAVILFPLIVADHYYAQSNDLCLNSDSVVRVTLKTFLFTSAVVNAFYLFCFVVFATGLALSQYTANDQSVLVGALVFVFFESVVSLFFLVWNILGSVLFWGALYGECGTEFTNYMCVSLVLKVVTSASIACSSWKRKHNRSSQL